MKYRSIAALTLLFLLPLATFQGTSRRAIADDPSYYSNFAKVTLHDLRANPTSFKTAQVRFHAYYHKIESIFSPFYTPFLPEQYIAFSIWEDDKKLWLKKDRMADFPFCFMRKDNKYITELTTTAKYTPIEVICTVKNDFNNTPWLEVDTAHATGATALTDKSLHHLVAGYEYLNGGQPALAEHEFWESLKYKLPDDAHLTVLLELGKIAFEAKRWKESEEYAHEALEMDSNNQTAADLYRASREEIVRAYNTGAPHGMNGPTGTDNAHPIPAKDTRDRRSSEAPTPASNPAVAQAGPAPSSDAFARLASANLRIAELESLLNAREKTLADRSASLAEKEAELLGLRREHEKNAEDQARYTSEVANYREQLASLQVEREKLMDGKVESNEALKNEVAALEARKSEIEKLLAGRDDLVAEMEKRGQDLETCKADLTGLMAQRDAVTREIAERKAEVEAMLAKRDGLAKELDGRKAELDQAIAARAGKDQELAARKAEVDGLVARTASTGKENEEIAKLLADRKVELEGILARREGLTKELAERAQALESAQAEVQAALGERDRLAREVEASKAALASAAEPKAGPTTAQPPATPDLSARLAEVTARLDELTAETAKLRGVLAQRDAEIDGLKRDLAARNARVTELERTAGDREQRIVGLQSEVARVKSIFARQSELLHEATDKLTAVESRLNSAGAPAETEEQIWRGRRTPSGRRTPEEIGK